MSGLKPILKLLSLCAFMGLAACGRLDGFNPLKSSADEKNEPIAAADEAEPVAGTNPHAKTRLVNVYNPLSDFCPYVRLRSGGEVFRLFAAGADGENGDNLRYQGTMIKVARECRYEGNDLKMEIGVRGRVITGPKGQSGGSINLPLRLSVQKADCSYLNKLYRRTVELEKGANSKLFRFVSETLVIPAPKETDVFIYIGFDNEEAEKPKQAACAG